MSCFDFLSRRSNALFKRFFFYLGLKIESHTRMFIIAGVIMMLIACLGFIRFNFEMRFLHFMVPRDSDIWYQYTHSIELFGPPSAAMSVLISVNNENNNILNNMQVSHEIYETINDINIDGITYKNSCLLLDPSSNICLSEVSNIFSVIFQNDANVWSNQSRVLETVNNNAANIIPFIGGLEYGNDKSIVGGTTLNLLYELTDYNDEDVYGYMSEWNEYWSMHKHDYIKDNSLKISYISDRSIDDEIWRVIIGDLYLFVVAFALMLGYFILVLGSFDCVHARLWLALSIGVVLIVSLIIGFGISMAIGAELSLIVLLIPFVLLGVGVDDMVIIVHAYDQAKKRSQASILAKSLKESGLAISLTSFCSCFGLGIAAAVPGTAPVITTFCVIGGFSFLANYIIQFFIFVPLLLKDERRQKNKRNFCCCCCITHGDENGTETNSDGKTDTQSASSENSKRNADDICSSFLVSLMKYRLIRWLIILLFMGSLYLSYLTISHIDTQSDLSLVVPDDSNIIDYYDVLLDAYDDELITELQIVIENEDFSDINVRNNIFNFLSEIEAHPNFIAQQNWFQPYLSWLDGALSLNPDNISSLQFYEHLKDFGVDNPDIVLDTENNMIEATRFYLFVFGNSDTTEQYTEYIEWNNVLTKHSINGYMFNAIYGFAYMSHVIVRLTFENILFAAAGVLFILLLTTDIRMAIFTILIVGSINMHLFGLMYILEFSLDIVTYAILVMSVGLTVDYVIHITVAIMHETETNVFSKKLQRAMKSMGVSVLKGAFTSLLGGIPLFFSASEAFRIFAAMWVGIIVIAVLHGFLLVPALMYEMYGLYNCICGGVNAHKEKEQYKEEIPRKSTTSTLRTADSVKTDLPRPSDMSTRRTCVQLETIMSETEENMDTKNEISQTPNIEIILANIECEPNSVSPRVAIERTGNHPIAIERTNKDKKSLQLNADTLADLMDIAEEMMSN